MVLCGNAESRWWSYLLIFLHITVYGFEDEVLEKYNSEVLDLFTKVFQWLPLAVVIGEKVLVVHGGIPVEETVTLKDIQGVERGMEPAEPSLMFD
jgi:serine/threonine-protein phosphatase 5